MQESKLRELSMEFSVEIIELVKYLKSIKEYFVGKGNKNFRTDFFDK